MGHWAPVRGEELRDSATANGVKTSRACTVTGATSVPLATQVLKTTGFLARTTCTHFHPPQPNGGKQLGRAGPSQARAHTIARVSPTDPPPPPPLDMAAIAIHFESPQPKRVCPHGPPVHPRTPTSRAPASCGARGAAQSGESKLNSPGAREGGCSSSGGAGDFTVLLSDMKVTSRGLSGDLLGQFSSHLLSHRSLQRRCNTS